MRNWPEGQFQEKTKGFLRRRRKAAYVSEEIGHKANFQEKTNGFLRLFLFVCRLTRRHVLMRNWPEGQFQEKTKGFLRRRRKAAYVSEEIGHKANFQEKTNGFLRLFLFVCRLTRRHVLMRNWPEGQFAFYPASTTAASFSVMNTPLFFSMPKRFWNQSHLQRKE